MSFFGTLKKLLCLKSSAFLSTTIRAPFHTGHTNDEFLLPIAQMLSFCSANQQFAEEKLGI